MLVTMLIILGIFMLLMMFQSRSQKKKQQHAQTMEERMVPGAWVMTSSGFYGRFVDQDGSVIILETADGHETFWLAQVVREVVDTPPFADAVASEPAAPVDDDLAKDTEDDDILPRPTKRTDDSADQA